MNSICTPIREIGSVYPSPVCCFNRPLRHFIVGDLVLYDVYRLKVADNVTNLEIKIPGIHWIHFQDQKIAMKIIGNNWGTIMNETEYAINKWIGNQLVYGIHLYAETIIQRNLRGTQGGILHASQGGLFKLSPLRSNCSWDSTQIKLFLIVRRGG
jgi:hypothetical protein